MPTTRKIARYGWRRDHLDPRDKIQRPPRAVALPPTCDLRGQYMPPVYDQGQLGSCTANGIAAAVDFARAKQGMKFLTPSRLFIYYNERVIEGTVDSDDGAEIRDGIKSVASTGVCPETDWPYTDDGKQFAVQPTPNCYSDSIPHKAVRYTSIPQIEYNIKYALAIDQHPIVFGFTVYDQFESDQMEADGLLQMPGPNDKPEGGHCVLACGYDDSTKRYLARNSWNSDWGIKGYFYVPYSYLEDPNLADDLWQIQIES